MADGLIFVGPSLRPPRPARAGIEYRPPAARGDLLAAAHAGARVVGLVDGLFHQDLAVSPREVRQAAAAGVRLFGGASIGALRAVECPMAMTGIGELHARFARGELTDDDEVALTFDPRSHALFAYPLVQIRAAAAILAATAPSMASALAELVARVRTRPFADRDETTLRRLVDELAAPGLTWERFATALTDPAADVKRRDALAVVDAVTAAIAAP